MRLFVESKTHIMDSLTSLFSVAVLIAEIAATVGVILLLLNLFVGVRYIPHDRVGIVEKLWSSRGSHLRAG